MRKLQKRKSVYGKKRNMYKLSKKSKKKSVPGVRMALGIHLVLNARSRISSDCWMRGIREARHNCAYASC